MFFGGGSKAVCLGMVLTPFWNYFWLVQTSIKTEICYMMKIIKMGPVKGGSMPVYSKIRLFCLFALLGLLGMGLNFKPHAT